MQKANLELMSFLESNLEGLVLRSEAAYPYEVSIWEVSEKGEFSALALLLSIGYLKLIDRQNTFEDINERLSEIEQNENIQFNRLHVFVNCIVPKEEGGLREEDFAFLDQLDISNIRDIDFENFSKRLAETLAERIAEKGSNFDQSSLFPNASELESHVELEDSKIRPDTLEAENFRSTILERLTNIRQKYSEIITNIESYLQELKVFRLSTSDLDFQRVYDIYIVIGRVRENSWIGFSTRLPEILHTESEPLSLQAGRPVEAIDPDVQEVISVFQRTVEGYTFPPVAPYYDFEVDEPSYPFDSFIWETSSNENSLMQQLLESMRFMQVVAPISNEYYNCLIDLPWDINDEENGEGIQEVELYSQKVTEVINFLEKHLTNQKIYRFGLTEIDVHIVGMTQGNDWVCLSSIAVET